MTLGTYMFYGGLACFGLCLVGLVITKAVLAAKGKKLKARLDEEYGLSLIHIYGSALPNAGAV